MEGLLLKKRKRRLKNILLHKRYNIYTYMK